MTKQQEIDAFRKFTGSIPQESYLRPWLDEIAAQIEADIRNDFPVGVMGLPTIADLRQRCATMVAEATTQARELIERANEHASEIETEAKAEVGRIRERLTAAIRDCERAACR